MKANGSGFVFCEGNLKKLGYLKVYGGLPREVYIFFIAKVITCMGMLIMPLWTLILTQKIGLSIPQAGLMATIFAITQAPSLMIGGKLIDAIGRKKVLFFCQTLGSLFYIVCACIPMSMLTAIFIVIASDFYAVAQPAIDALLADVTTPENRKASYSLHYFGLNLGYTIAPLLGGLLFQRYLPVLFILDAVTTMFSTLLIVLYVKEPDHKRNLANLSAEHPQSDRSIPLLKLLWQMRVLLYFLIIMVIYQFCYTQWTFMLPLQMAAIYHDGGARHYSYLVALNAFIVIAFTPLVTALSHKFRPLAVSVVSGLCFFAAFITFGLALRLPLFMVAIFIFTVGEILNAVNLSTFLADQTPPTHRGRVNSLSAFSHGATQALGPLIMGNVVVLTGYFAAWWAVAALMLTGALCMFALNRMHSRTTAEKTGSIQEAV